MKGAPALYFLKRRGRPRSSSSASCGGLATYVLNIQPIVAAAERLKRSRAPSLTHGNKKKQHGPIVTTVGFWIQYNKIASPPHPDPAPLPPLSPYHPDLLRCDLTPSWEKWQDGFSLTDICLVWIIRPLFYPERQDSVGSRGNCEI